MVPEVNDPERFRVKEPGMVAAPLTAIVSPKPRPIALPLPARFNVEPVARVMVVAAVGR